MQQDVSELVHHPFRSPHNLHRDIEETSSRYDSNARARRDDESKRLQTEISRNISERCREE